MSVQRMVLARSAWLVLTLVAVHAAAAAALWLAPLPAFVQAAVTVPLLLSLAFHAVRDAALAAPQSIVMLAVREPGRIDALTRRGDWLECEVLGSTYVSPHWTVLNLRALGARGFRPVIILPDSIDPEDFRRLRAWLRWRGASESVPGDPAA